MKKKIYIFGLGYVGYPLMLLLANVKKNSCPLYEVTGIELNKKRKILEHCVQNGITPFKSEDKKLFRLAKSSLSKKINILEKDHLKNLSGIILICINFDGLKKIDELKKFFHFLSKKISPSSTIIIESTLIPGTSEKILYPIIIKNFIKRKIDVKKLAFGFSYERIMPGDNYIDSIVNNYKSISGINNFSKNKILKFYKSFLNFKKFPIYSFQKITECETAKIVENSYRAVNISFVDEWNRFSQKHKLNLKSIINSIKVRNTHSNIMRPGVGVGGYCLTKDPSFGQISSKAIFKTKNLFPLSTISMKINKKMPKFCFQFIVEKIKKTDKILLIGSAYKKDVSDTRFSPSLNLFKMFLKKGYKINNIDPIVNKKKFLDIFTSKIKNFNVIIFSVPHKYFEKISLSCFKSKTKIFDVDYVFKESQINILKKKNLDFYLLGDFSE